MVSPLLATQIKPHDLVEMQILFIEGLEVHEIQRHFQGLYSVAQIENIVKPQKLKAKIPPPNPIKAQKGKFSFYDAYIPKRMILQNLDGSLLPENDIEEINRRCSFVEGFRHWEMETETDEIKINFFSRRNDEVRLKNTMSFLIQIKECDKLPSVEDLRQSRVCANFGIDPTFIVETLQRDGKCYYNIIVPSFLCKEVCAKFGIPEKLVVGDKATFAINIRECPVCLEIRHCVKINCPSKVKHFLCPKCTQDWNTKSTKFSCPTCRAEHDKSKIQKLLVKDQNRHS